MYRGLCFFVFFVVSTSMANDHTPRQLSECRRITGIDTTNVDHDIESISRSRDQSCYVMCLEFYRNKVNRFGQVVPIPQNSQDSNSLGENSLISAVFQEGLRRCANEIGTDFCDTAWKTVQCLSKNPMFKRYKKETDMNTVHAAMKEAIARLSQVQQDHNA